MNKITKPKYNEKTFEDIKHTNEFGNEYWEARDLQKVLEYVKWQKFLNVIERAIVACNNSGYDEKDHFTQVGKMINLGKNASREIIDFHLSRYACYLIVQNADPNKEVIALGQTYFAIQTRKQEISEKDYHLLSEEEKRFYQRNLTKKGNYSLNQLAKEAGVKNFDKFHNFGYKGLYGGETANAIAKRKKLRYREDILDNMGSEELINNLFRITHTGTKLKRNKVQTEKEANKTHFEMGKNIREFIAKEGGTMPEKLPTPNKSLKELEKEKKRLEVKSG